VGVTQRLCGVALFTGRTHPRNSRLADAALLCSDQNRYARNPAGLLQPEDFMQFRSVLLSCTLVLACSTAHADDASKMAKVHEFFRLAKLDQLSTQAMDQVMTQMNSGMMQQMAGAKLTGDDQKKLDEFSGKVKQLVNNAMGWQALEPQYAKLYADAYTEQQLDDLIAFYKSPTGQVMVEKTPILMKESSAIAQQKMVTLIPEFQNLLKEYMPPPGSRTQQ
jgi:uncharacterized protein